MTNKQLKDLKTIEYFMPKNYDGMSCQDDENQTLIVPKYGEGEVAIIEYDRDGLDPEEAFFLHSDQGQKRIKTNNLKRFNQLLQGKRWRGIHIHEMYEPGVFEESVPYFTLLGGEIGENITPKEVVEFMSKEMFKGDDKELIMETYQEILKNKK